jgi:hypothetical protein
MLRRKSTCSLAPPPELKAEACETLLACNKLLVNTLP